VSFPIVPLMQHAEGGGQSSGPSHATVCQLGFGHWLLPVQMIVAPPAPPTPAPYAQHSDGVQHGWTVQITPS
jgi:hypothetical protein